MKIEEAINKFKEARNREYSEEEISDLCEKYPEIKYALLSLIPLLNIQPERSKREDAKKECDEFGHLNTWMPKNQTLCMRCGALSSMET